MEGVETTLQQVQVAVLSVISSETILVGHSVENDLKALKMIHRKCVDSVVLYPHPKGFPYRQSLRFVCTYRIDHHHLLGLFLHSFHHFRFITRKYLDRDIQSFKSNRETNQVGHDSVEDAHSALMLTILKANMGRYYGIDLSAKPELQEVNGRISLFDHLTKDLKSSYGTDSSLQSAIMLHGSSLFDKNKEICNVLGGASCSIRSIIGTLSDPLRECIKFISSSSSTSSSSPSSSCLPSNILQRACFIGSDFQCCASAGEDLVRTYI